MKDERLYIDGELVDIDGSTKITMDIKSNLFRDVSQIASNSTYTVKLPKTVRNQMILKHTDLVQERNSYPYLVHTVRYFRNGVEVIKNGRLTVLKVSDTAIEVCIVWGLYPNFSELISTGATLNQLDTKDRIIFHDITEPDNYDDVLNMGYFYAAYSTTRKEDSVDYSWRTTHDMIFPILQEGRHEGTWGGGHWKSTGAIEGLHPVVRVSWVLDLIREKKNIDFRFPREEKEYIDTLVIPLISKKSNELTFDGLLTADLLPKDEKGVVSLAVKETTNVFKGAVGDTLTSVEATANADVLIDVKATWEFNLAGRKPVGHSNNFYHNEPIGYNHYAFKYGYWLKITIRSGFNNVEELIVGPNEMNFYVTAPDTHNGVVKFQYSGYGKASIEEHSTITVEWLSDGVIDGAKFTGGEVKINLQKSDNVLNGGYFPITSNLPKIKIIDFVKFLAVVTGTFPLQMNDENTVRFVPLSTIWQNRGNALDWTEKVIAAGSENKPQSIDFSISDYCQHNLYKWKTDDTVKGNYDGDLRIFNDTLEVEKTIVEFPFAATDGDSVPMYEERKKTESTGGTFGNGKPQKDENASKVETTSTGGGYKACKDRVLRLSKSENGKAVARFDINMQEIINDKYHHVARSMERTKVVTEKVHMSDIELMNFDETRPVYLAQYGSYFAITEIKADEVGLAEVTMFQLYMD